MPVKIKDGESPVKGGGLLYVIDGGISKAYQKQTGIAGYTFIFNSRFMALAQHKPYSPLQPDGTQVFHSPVMQTVETLPSRMMVLDTDQGAELVQNIEDLKQLVDAYRRGNLRRDSSGNLWSEKKTLRERKKYLTIRVLSLILMECDKEIACATSSIG